MPTITHIMADGTVFHSAKEVRAYLEDKELPELAQRLIAECIERGARMAGSCSATDVK